MNEYSEDVTNDYSGIMPGDTFNIEGVIGNFRCVYVHHERNDDGTIYESAIVLQDGRVIFYMPEDQNAYREYVIIKQEAINPHFTLVYRDDT